MRRRRYYVDYETRELARDPIDGKIGGVCAGIARYLNVSSIFVRIAMLVLLVAAPHVALTAYAILYFVLDERI
ncbi:MAG: PspC domain-containing protein [Pseudomonadota bacterium]